MLELKEVKQNKQEQTCNRKEKRKKKKIVSRLLIHIIFSVD